jgi:hypothetical protein
LEEIWFFRDCKKIRRGEKNTKKGEIKGRTEDAGNRKKSICRNVLLCWKQSAVNMSIKVEGRTVKYKFCVASDNMIVLMRMT